MPRSVFVWQWPWKQTITSYFGNTLNPQSNARVLGVHLRSCGFCSIDFKMDMVPEDGEYSATHKQSFRDRTFSLGSVPQTSSVNFRNSRALRLRGPIASKGITCVYSIVFGRFLSYPLTVSVARILNLPKLCRPSLVGICHTPLRVYLGSKPTHSLMSIHKHAVFHPFPLPRPPHPSSLRARAGN